MQYNKDLLSKKASTCAVLCSRQSLRPHRGKQWVDASTEAVSWVRKQGLRLVSSVGMNTWDLLTSLASITEVEQKIVVPYKKKVEEVARKHIIEQYDLTGDCTELQLVCGMTSQERDGRVIEIADILLPVSIRPGGTMSRRIEQHEAAGKPVIRDFEVKYDPNPDKLSYRIDTDQLSKDISGLNGQYLIHWTRASNNPWPTERIVDYYRDVVSSTTYPRDGISTLTNILKKQQIYGSSQHILGNSMVCCFSGLSPARVISLMRYRARYRQMSFEPYGVGIERSVAERLGIVPVTYYDRTGKFQPPNDQAWCYQSRGTQADWTVEDEYRCKGDLDLSRIDQRDLIVFTRFEAEAKMIRQKFGYHAVSFQTG